MFSFSLRRCRLESSRRGWTPWDPGQVGASSGRCLAVGFPTGHYRVQVGYLLPSRMYRRTVSFFYRQVCPVSITLAVTFKLEFVLSFCIRRLLLLGVRALAEPLCFLVSFPPRQLCCASSLAPLPPARACARWE